MESTNSGWHCYTSAWDLGTYNMLISLSVPLVIVIHNHPPFLQHSEIMLININNLNRLTLLANFLLSSSLIFCSMSWENLCGSIRTISWSSDKMNMLVLLVEKLPSKAHLTLSMWNEPHLHNQLRMRITINGGYTYLHTMCKYMYYPCRM